MSAKLINDLGAIPLVRNALRWYAQRYAEGSVVRIARGEAAGMLWRRHHRYVNGYWTGIYELGLQGVLARELKSGATVYDVGANAGFFSLLAAKLVGKDGRVFSFEPLPENIESILEQKALNSLDHCELITKAVSDNCGQASLTVTDNNSTAHLSRAKNDALKNEAVKSENELTIETITLDEFARHHKAPDFVKVDVEGAETAVLDGAKELLSSIHAPVFLIELHGEDKALRVEAQLAEYSYTLTDLAGAPLKNGVAGHQHILAYPSRHRS